MSCGCAVACSDRASLPELVGPAGALFDPEQPTAIAQTIVKVLSDEERRREYEMRALERAAAYTWEATAAKTLDIYRRLSRNATDV
jgi:alpha-1,3-rhamnosyl/mannosyltransferase